LTHLAAIEYKILC